LKVRHSMRTRTGVMPTNPNKVNQDSLIACPNFADSPDQFFYSVNDGHGVYGHFVSNFIREKLPSTHESFRCHNMCYSLLAIKRYTP
jgi:serine/threonine protein phosphatase PrpC